MTLGKLLHVLTMLTKLLCTLKVTFSMKVGPTEIKEDDSEDTPFDKRRKTSFYHFEKGVKRVDSNPVTSVIKKSKILTSLKDHKDRVHAGVRYSGDQCEYPFKDKNRMGVHREYFHEAVRYSCKLCD